MVSTAKPAEKNTSPNEQEGKLKQFYLQTDVNRAKLGLIILIAPILALLLNDFELFGISTQFYGLLALRLGLLAYTIIQLWYLSRINNYRAYERSITAWGFVSVASIIAVNLTRPASFIPTQIITVILYIFIILLVIPNRFRNQLFLSLIVTLGEASIIIFSVNSLTLATLVTNLFSLTLTFVIGALSSWQLNSDRHRGFLEINERKNAENSLQTSLSRLYNILSSMHGSILLVSAEGRVEFANQSFCDQFSLKESPTELKNLPSEEMIEKIKNGYMHPDQEVSRIRELVATGKIVTGEEVAMQSNRTFIRDFIPFSADGSAFSRLWHHLEITERKKAEEAVRESEQRLKFHAENIPLAVVEWDSNFVVTRWAGDAQKMFGWKADETVGKPIMDLHLIYEPDIPIVEKTMAKLTSGETKVVSANRNVTKDGDVIHCTWINSVLLDPSGKMVSVLSFVEDNTATKNAEKALEENNRNLEKIVEERTKQLKDTERLAAIGATAGMVGHDIRNPLQAIIGDIYLVKSELASTPESDEKISALESLQEIEKNIDYINKIVADLQDFAKPLRPHEDIADLKLLIDRLLEKNGLSQNIAIKVAVEPDAQKVVADADFINRILYNLVINASQAMPEGGKLTIKTYNEASDVVISVKDTGVGIPEKVKDKLFTPMFTTKSKGQGFGLAVVKRMTEALGGTVNFESQEGKGTTFIIRLPQKNN